MHDPKTRFGAILPEKLGVAVQYVVHLCIVFLCAPGLVPGVNESHYLPKAKHAWDSSYAAGGDLFLESHDSHMLATAAAGWLAYVLPLAGVAWLGRLASWLLLIYAWLRLTRSLGLTLLIQPLAFIAWFLAMKYGHWAGEWMVGGFEAKAIAYPLVLLGLSSIIENRWRSGWLWLAFSVAWHPVVGGWAGVSVGLVWLTKRDFLQRFRAEWPALALAMLIGLIGVLPAAAGLGQALEPAEKVAPAQVHVYYRLAHHMCPRTFAPERHVLATFNLLALVGATFFWMRGQRRSAQIGSRPALRTTSAQRTTSGQRTASGQHTTSGQSAVGESAGSLTGQVNAGVRFILWVGWMSVSISLVGLLIDATLSTKRPDIAANFLRFYWFRWSDIAVPLAWTITFWVAFQRGNFALEPTGRLRPTELGSYLFGLLFIAICSLFGLHAQHNLERKYPEADEWIVQSTGPYPVTGDRYLDWLAVCRWIDENTPTDSLWLTPKYQQTFKWHAGRAEVVAWKDVPQDNASVVEWYHRVQRCSPPRDAAGQVREWTTEELIELAKAYRFEWILLDRTYQQTPPRLEIMYPINIENRSFAICRIPASWLGDK